MSHISTINMLLEPARNIYDDNLHDYGRACALGRRKQQKKTEQGFAKKLEALGRFVDLVNRSSAFQCSWSTFRQFFFKFLSVHAYVFSEEASCGSSEMKMG